MALKPPKTLEKVVTMLIPPACREEVVGDMHERYASTGQYILEAIQVIPMVVASRIRRTADPQVVLLESLALFFAFLVGGWYQEGTFAFLYADGGFLMVAIPCTMILLGIVLADAYATPGRRSPLKSMWGLILGLGAACIAESVLTGIRPQLVMPGWMMFYGSIIAVLLVSSLRILFPPVADRPLGAGGPAFWLKHEGNSSGTARAAVDVIRSIGFIVAIGFIGTWMGGPSLGKPLVMVLAMILVVREVNRKR
jgi:hypothetical protein